jgi:hypothetical protein
MTVAAAWAVGATKTTAVTEMAGGTNSNQLKAIRGSGRNGGGGGGSSDGSDGDRNSNSNGNDDGDSNNANADALCTPLKASFAPPSTLAE